MAGKKSKKRQQEKRRQARMQKVPNHDESENLFPVAQIKPFKGQPRKEFDSQKLAALKGSIIMKGQLTPVVLTFPDESGMSELIEGERRTRVFQMLAKEGFVNAGKIKAVFMRVSDIDDHFQLSFTANCAREELTPIETANAIVKLQNQGYSIEEIAQMAGKGVSWVYNHLKLLKLNPAQQEEVKSKKLPRNVAVAVSSFPKDKQDKIAEKVREELATAAEEGRSLAPNEATKFVAKAAKELKIKPLPQSRGGAPQNFETRAVNDATRSLLTIKALVLDVLEIDPGDLEENVTYDELAELQYALQMRNLSSSRCDQLKFLAKKLGVASEYKKTLSGNQPTLRSLLLLLEEKMRIAI